MGGKRLKFPKRKKFVSLEGDVNFKQEGEKVSWEEYRIPEEVTKGKED